VATEPPTAPDFAHLFAQFERTIATQLAALRDDNQHLRHELDALRHQMTAPPPIVLNDAALGAIAEKLLPMLPITPPATPHRPSPAKPSPSRPAPISTPTAKINLNRATVVELCQVKGLGKSKAEAILKRRQAQGDFTSIDQLAALSGITQNTIQKNRWSDLLEV
jgi:competence protein ComEA